MARDLLTRWVMCLSDERCGSGLARPKLLLVEDERLLNRVLCQRLRSLGYSVVAAESLEEARDQLRRTQFDLFVIDVELPDGDGLSLLDPDGLDRRSRTLVISARARYEHFARRGVRHFLRKPFGLAEIGSRIEGIAAAAWPGSGPGGGRAGTA